MAKKIQVLGIELENYTVRDHMCFLEEYLLSDELNIVSIVSSQLLMLASEDEHLREFISHQADLRIIADTAILEVQEEKYEQQYGQIKRKDLEEQFLRTLIRKKKRVFWIGAKEEQKQDFEHYIETRCDGLKLVGTMAGCIEEEANEHIINEINSADVDVLILNLQSPKQEQFIQKYKHLLHVKLCICVGEGVRTKYASGIRVSKLKEVLDQTMFKRKALKYAADQNE